MDVKNTIKSSIEIERLFKTGRKIITRSTIALVDKSKIQRDQCGRAAFIAGKRLGSAPSRSRAKRRMREAARIAGIPVSGLDVVLIAKREASYNKFDDLISDMKQIVRRCTVTSGKCHE